MLSRPTRLSIKHPSPTTVSFTVSNAFSKKTISAKIGLLIGILLRISFVVLVVLLVAAKVRWVFLPDPNITTKNDEDWRSRLPGLLLVRRLWMNSSFAASVANIADKLKTWVLGLLSVLLLKFSFQKWHTEETLLVLRGLGIQTSTSSPTYLSTTTTRFIPTTQIQDIVIHEAFKGFEVRFYLAILVEGEKEVVVVFPNLLPNRYILEEVWRGARKCLYEPKT